MTAAKRPPALLLLRIRSYPHVSFVSAWLERVDGAMHSGIFHGEMLPQAAEELAAAFAALGVPVEREEFGTDPAVPFRGITVGEAAVSTATTAAVAVSPPGDLFAGQEGGLPRPEPEPADRVRPRRKRKKGEGT